MFGSRAEVMRGLMRALARPGARRRSAWYIAALPAAGYPRHGRDLRGRADAERPPRYASVQTLFAGFPELGRHGARGAKGTRSPWPCASFTWRATPPPASARRRRARRPGRPRPRRRRVRPAVAAALADGAAEILALDPGTPVWDSTLSAEPGRRLILSGDAIDRALAAMGDFADLLSPYLSGHSAGVADLAAAAAQQCGLGADDVRGIRRGARPRSWAGRRARRDLAEVRPADRGRVGAVRLHPYQSERVLARSPFLSRLAGVASAHHERLDGSGYHRGATGAALPLPAQVLAAADAYHAMTERGHTASRCPPRRRRSCWETRPARDGSTRTP